MAGIREPIPPAVAGELVPWVAPDQEPRLANAVHAETLLGDVDHGVAIGLFDKSAPVLFAREEKEMALVEYAPPRIAGSALPCSN